MIFGIWREVSIPESMVLEYNLIPGTDCCSLLQNCMTKTHSFDHLMVVIWLQGSKHVEIDLNKL